MPPKPVSTLHKIRSKPNILSDPERKEEFARLGIKVKITDVKAPDYGSPNRNVLDKIYLKYIEGSGLAFDTMHLDPYPSWIPPLTPSPDHLAILDHKDETIATQPITLLHRSPHWCYLAEQGILDKSNWSGAHQALVPLGARIWEAACKKATDSKQQEGVFLNPMSLAILKKSLNTFATLTDSSLRQSRRSYHPIFKNGASISSDNFPIGPGFEGFLDKFKTWLQNASISELRQLRSHQTKNYPVALLPWILQYAQAAKDPKVLLDLLPLTGEGTEKEHDSSRLMNFLLSNSSITKEGLAVLYEWAVKQALLPSQLGDPHAIREIFKYLADHSLIPSYSISPRLLVFIHANSQEEPDPKKSWDDEQPLRTLAMIPEASHNKEIRKHILATKDHDPICELLYHSVGSDWLEIAEYLNNSSFAKNPQFLNALKYTKARHLEGLRPKDLSSLLNSKNKDVRTQIIKLATLIKAPVQKSRTLR